MGQGPPRPQPAPERIEVAASAIDPVFLGSPLVDAEVLDDVLGCRVLAKVETLNPIRSFKGRGASWFVRSGAVGDTRDLVASSAGNFGQGLAHAARNAGYRLTVFAATSANPDKITAMRRFGAEVVLAGADFDAAKEAGAQFAASTGARLVVDGDEPAIAEGAGTIALELLLQCRSKAPDAVLVPLGNGALIAGIGTWLRHAAPTTRIVGVTSVGAPAMARSWRAHTAVETPAARTIADGIAVRVPVPYALSTLARTVDDVMEVDDAALIHAMRIVHRHLGLVVEPAGVAGVAALLAEPERFAGATLATVLCGANIDRSRARHWLFDDG